MAASCGLLASCSLVTSWDGLMSAGGPQDAGLGGAGGRDAMSASVGSTGGAASDAGDASPDSAADVIEPPLCTPKHHYCGGHVVMGTTTKLYVCNDDSASTSLVETCAHGCLVRPLSKDDHCRCLAGGVYCGGDHIEGDPSTLYKCNADGSGTLFEHCTKGCVVTAGKDDSCG